jgi:hypothetical protein
MAKKRKTGVVILPPILIDLLENENIFLFIRPLKSPASVSLSNL